MAVATAARDKAKARAKITSAKISRSLTLEKLRIQQEAKLCSASSSPTWLDSEEVRSRDIFCRQLQRIGVPVPQTEGEFHAARVYNDAVGRATYDHEQWTDYLEIKGIV